MAASDAALSGAGPRAAAGRGRRRVLEAARRRRRDLGRRHVPRDAAPPAARQRLQRPPAPHYRSSRTPAQRRPDRRSPSWRGCARSSLPSTQARIATADSLGLVQSVPGVEHCEARAASGPCSCCRNKQRGESRPPARASLPRERSRANAVVLDLGRVQVVRTITFPLRGTTPATSGRASRIEGSTDARRGRLSGWTGPAASRSPAPLKTLSSCRCASSCRTCRFATCASTRPKTGWRLRFSRVLGF